MSIERVFKITDKIARANPETVFRIVAGVWFVTSVFVAFFSFFGSV